MIHYKNINKPTSAKWNKVALLCTTLSTFVAGYGLTAGIPIVGYIGLGLGAAGVSIPIMMAPEKEDEPNQTAK
jgi:hypothetical protein